MINDLLKDPIFTDRAMTRIQDPVPSLVGLSPGDVRHLLNE